MTLSYTAIGMAGAQVCSGSTNQGRAPASSLRVVNCIDIGTGIDTGCARSCRWICTDIDTGGACSCSSICTDIGGAYGCSSIYTETGGACS
jgi:hypothetical protein